MGHFAKVVDGIVEDVIVAESDYVESLSDSDKWIQTSYNTRHGVHCDPITGEPDGGTPLRKNYAGIGYSYDADRDAFIPPKSYPSWVLDEDKCDWVAPTAMPDDGQFYDWDESTTSWVVVTK